VTIARVRTLVTSVVLSLCGLETASAAQYGESAWLHAVSAATRQPVICSEDLAASWAALPLTDGDHLPETLETDSTAGVTVIVRTYEFAATAVTADAVADAVRGLWGQRPD